MMRFWAIWLLLGLFASAQTRYQSSAHHFSLALPSGWTVQPPQQSNAVVTFTGPSSEVSVFHFSNRALDSMVTTLSQALESSGFRHQEDKTIRVAEVPGHISMWKKGQNVALMTVLVSGADCYVLSGDTLEGNHGPYIEVINSFRVERIADSTTREPGQLRPEDFGEDF